MGEAPLTRSETESPPAERMEVIARYEEQLNQLASRLNDIRTRLVKLSEAGLDRFDETEMKEMLTWLGRRIDLLRDYIKTFEIQHKIETNRLGDAKKELDELIVKYSHIPESVLDFVLSIVTDRIKQLQGLYHDKLREESDRIIDEASRLQNDIIRVTEEILRNLK